MTPLERDLPLPRYPLMVVVALYLPVALHALWLQQWLLGLMLAGLAILLTVHSRSGNQHGDRPEETLLSQIISVWLVAGCLLSLYLYPGSLAALTTLTAPALLFLLSPVRRATIVSAGITLIFALLVWLAFRGPEKPLLFFSFFLYLLVILGFVYLREVNESQIRPLRRTDNLTLAATRDYLLQELGREIQRNEREGTSLSVMSLGLDRATLARLNREQVQRIMNDMGQLLRSRLRIFDNYYRYNESELVVILPCTASADARVLGDRLKKDLGRRLGSRQQLISVAVGLTSLNVGDTATSMVDSARKALQQEQNHTPVSPRDIHDISSSPL